MGITDRRLMFGILLIAVLVFFALRDLHAGDNEKDKEKDKDVVNMGTGTDDAPFVFEPGDRRDPFSFIKSIPKIAEPVGPATGPDTPDPLKLDPAAIAQKKMEALTNYNVAEQAFMAESLTDALQHCDRGLEVFKDVVISQYRELQEIRDSLLRLRKAAERAKQRFDIDREFTMLNMKVTGVVSRQRNPQAIVNSSVVGKGDMIGENAVVSDIRPNEVLFLYKGFKLALTVEK